MDHVQLGDVTVSRLILGSNPFSGFSHQGSDRDAEMKRYYTTARIKETIREAESLGISAMVGRADHHVIRILMEYRDEGGEIQWLTQTCPEYASHDASVTRAAVNGAKACFVHGGIMDFLLSQGRMGEVPGMIDAIRKKGMAAGIAGHNPQVFEWAEEHLDVDFYMCCYYNAARRDNRAEHVSGMKEWFLDEDRETMTALIQTLSRPAIHYKILAAGRKGPDEAFAYAASRMRPVDAVCVGVHTKDKPDMLRENVRLLDESLAACAV